MSNISTAAATKFGDTLPFSEPAWYDSRNPSPYYNDAKKNSSLMNTLLSVGPVG